ncbi:MAG: hypothetical protein BGO26_07110 [Actinobacteria bacterium 69-20]|nr:MAG: hypothetical protein BGO26_07110 [Actinobacteria bacterium 69-20]
MESERGSARVAPRHLRDHLLERGVHSVDMSAVVRLTGASQQEAAATMMRLRRAGQFFSPTPGLYVAIPPRYASWGVVPAMDFIEPLMDKLSRRYYVGLLSAAELHGAAHQRPQVFQVMVDKPLADRDFRRVRLRFYTRTAVERYPTVLRNSATGQVRISTPEVTALDLAARPNDAGGLNNVATILGELAMDSKLSPAALSEAATLFPQAVARRLGWLLDRVAGEADTAELAAVLGQLLEQNGPRVRAQDLLDPAGPRRGTAGNRWHVVENSDVEPDL